MNELPTRDELRAEAEALDVRQRKILTAMVLAMIEHSDRVRDREWISERFATTVAVALDLDDDPSLASAAEGVERVRAYANEHAPRILGVAFGIFGRVAVALQERGQPFGPQDAVDEAMACIDGPS